MLELRRCLSEKENILSRLFHIELKGLIKHGLGIMEKMPSPGINVSELENYNSRILVGIRDKLISHAQDKRDDGLTNSGIIKGVMDFVVLLYDSDEAWRRMIYQAILEIKNAEFHPEEEPRPEYWK